MVMYAPAGIDHRAQTEIPDVRCNKLIVSSLSLHHPDFAAVAGHILQAA